MRQTLVSLLAVGVFAVSPLVFAQSVQPSVTSQQQQYYFTNHALYEIYKVVNVTSEVPATVKGVVLQSIQNTSSFQGYPGVEVKLVKGTEIVSKTTDKDGKFEFENVAATGDYKIYAQDPSNPLRVGNIELSFSSTPINANQLSDNTTIGLVDSLKLLLSDGSFRYIDESRVNSLQLNRPLNNPATPNVASPTSSNFPNSGFGSRFGGGNGNFGGLALLGAVGGMIATSAIAASDDDNNTPSTPVSVGAPSSGKP
ncbi:MAG: hypothetical protein LBT05_16330 [Planctomycetaceae bacterium]|jgi:hypothetical protein|nr:hypothetical protein [Planctomycetaceae bacterium]